MISQNIKAKINKCIEICACLKQDKETGRSFHATFIYDKGKLLSIGFNNYKKLHRRHIFGNYKGFKDNPEKYVASIHSEIDALIKLGRTDCSRLTFINIRIDKNNLANIAKPCENCFKVLQGVGFKNLYYTTNYGDIESL